MKRILSVVLCIILIAALAACGEEQKGNVFFVVDTKCRDDMTALFKSTDSDETQEVKMTKQESNDDSVTFACYADPDRFDRVVLTSGDDSTIELAYNAYVAGWVLDEHRFTPYDTGYPEPKYERKSFDYEKRTKDVLIWVPDTYDPSSDKKYSVIYMTDGQNLFNPSATSTGSWGAAESVRAMVAQTNQNDCIIVGIENADGWRDDELTPDIGEVLSEDYKNGHGEYFSDFVVDTVMPYINENYNVYTDREHTHVAGSSSGGIESFYIAMAHPDKFASVGALSPAFLLYSDDTWVEWLSGQDYSENAPFVYLYCGNGSGDMLEQQLYAGTKAMPDNLKKIGYPEDKVVMKLYEDGLHNEMYWRAVFPDYLKYAFPITQTATPDQSSE